MVKTNYFWMKNKCLISRYEISMYPFENANKHVKIHAGSIIYI